MTPARLIETLAARGVSLRLAGDTVKVKGTDRLTDTELRTLRDHRDTLRRYLAANDDPLPDLCPNCRYHIHWRDPAGVWHCGRCDPRGNRPTRELLTCPPTDEANHG